MQNVGPGATPAPTSTAELIFTGDELLRGDTVNTNQAYLGDRLLGLGIFPRRALCVIDDLAEIVAAIRDSLRRQPSVLILSGGLGPTADDLTREAVAEALGLPLEFHEDLLADIEQRFATRGLVMSESNRKQAFLPQGATVIPFLGTAPGFYLQHQHTLVTALPGVPWELKDMWEQSLEPVLRSQLPMSSTVSVRRIRTFGLGESTIAQLLSSLDWHDPTATIGTRAALDGVTILVRGHTDVEGQRRLDEIEHRILALLGDRVYSLGPTGLPETVGMLLRERGLTVAVAESCTGGLLAKRLTDVPGSSRYFLGGIVAYANAVKTNILGVPDQLLASKGAVSEEVAAAMAQGVRRLLGSDCALATTGIAGPDGGSPEKPVGLVYVACGVGDAVTVERLHLFGDRDQIRERAAFSALDLLRRQLRLQASP